MRRRLLVALAATILTCAGIGAAVAVADSSANAIAVCATATTPGHTVAIDGAGVATWPGDTASACTVTTYTVPTVTQTVTVTGTTATTTSQATTTTPTMPTTTSASPAYLFDDEFNGAAGTKPSSTLWAAKTGSSNGSAHWNGWNQISEDGQGDLVITAQKDSAGTWQSGFLSGRVAYSGPEQISARAKLACGAGVWDAPVWSWGAPYGTSPSIEIDVNETLPGKDPAGTYHATLHNWNGSTNPQSGKVISVGQPLCGGFHTYSADVYPDHVDFYFDGTLESTTTASAVGLPDLTTWKEVANIDLNMGGWAGTIGITGPVQMLVDYIRVSPLP